VEQAAMLFTDFTAQAAGYVKVIKLTTALVYPKCLVK
jgi:hypothetical protein